MLDRSRATVEAITAAESSTQVVAYLSAEFPIDPDLGNGPAILRSEATNAERQQEDA